MLCGMTVRLTITPARMTPGLRLISSPASAVEDKALGKTRFPCHHGGWHRYCLVFPEIELSVEASNAPAVTNTANFALSSVPPWHTMSHPTGTRELLFQGVAMPHSWEYMGRGCRGTAVRDRRAREQPPSVKPALAALQLLSLPYRVTIPTSSTGSATQASAPSS